MWDLVCALNTSPCCTALPETRALAQGDDAVVHKSLCPQVRSAKKVELQAQKRSEKAAREAAQKDKEQRSYSHLMQARRKSRLACASPHPAE